MDRTVSPADLQPQVECETCGRRFPAREVLWRCPCGGPLAVRFKPVFPLETFEEGPLTQWRFRAALALEDDAVIVSLGEGMTPLVAADWDGADARFKLDYLNPTGSFKDRGVSTLVSWLRQAGIGEVVEDSSGNAGAALAGYCAHAGIDCRIFVPADTPPGKVVQMVAFGATITRVPGPRAATTEAVLAAARDTFYASHNWHPFFGDGTRTYAFEIAEQLGWRAPDHVVAPAGSGSLILAAFEAFSQLRDAGKVSRMPRIHAAQAAACAPLALAWQRGASAPSAVDPQPTAADGIRIAAPVRGGRVLAALRASGGSAVAVSEGELWAAWRRLARLGLYVEPTSAVPAAALSRLRAAGTVAPGEVVAVPLTGSGLKATALIQAQSQSANG